MNFESAISASVQFVIVIDDTEEVRDAIVRALSSYDIHVVAFERPLEALDYIWCLGPRAEPVIICDYDMPELNGRAVFDRLERRHQARFVLHTGNHDVPCPPGGKLLRKPARLGQLREIVEAMRGTPS